jgi:hypothetical protein
MKKYLTIKKALTYENIFLFSFTFLILLFSFASSGSYQFENLARSFLQGKLYIEPTDTKNLIDSILWNGHFYWHLGPFPSFLISPFIIVFDSLNMVFKIGYLQFFVNVGVLTLAYLLAKNAGYSVKNSKILAFTFCFSSLYLSVTMFPNTWYFPHAISTFLCLIALYEYKRIKINYWLIGTFFAFVFLTRFTAGLVFLYIVLNDIFKKKTSFPKIAKKQIKMLIPIILAGVWLLFYNNMRFGNVFNNGYLYTNNWQLAENERYKASTFNLFDTAYIPVNFYYYFFHSFDIVVKKNEGFRNLQIISFPFIKPGLPTMSVFISSPIFLLLFITDYRKKGNLSLLIPAIFILLILLSYYFIGTSATGPRYLIDLIPLAYLLLLNSFKQKRLSNFNKILIYSSALLNLYFLVSFLIVKNLLIIKKNQYLRMLFDIIT